MQMPCPACLYTLKTLVLYSLKPVTVSIYLLQFYMYIRLDHPHSYAKDGSVLIFRRLTG